MGILYLEVAQIIVFKILDNTLIIRKISINNLDFVLHY